jgi:hypothetical protein
MKNIVKACVILHNMVIDDRKEMTIDDHIEMTRSIISESEVQTLPNQSEVADDARDLSLLPMDFMCRKIREVQDRDLHRRRTNDLIEHFWSEFGNSAE